MMTTLYFVAALSLIANVVLACLALRWRSEAMWAQREWGKAAIRHDDRDKAQEAEIAAMQSRINTLTDELEEADETNERYARREVFIQQQACRRAAVCEIKD